MKAMPADPVPESLGARRPAEESTATADELGGRERLASMVNEPAAVTEELMALPKAPEGVVRHAMWPLSPLVVPPAVEEEDEVEEIKHEES